MKKNYLSKIFYFVNLLIIIVLTSCKNNNSPNGAATVSTNTPPITYRRAAEFEPMEAIWLLWSNYDHKDGYSNHKVQSDIIAALLPYVKIKLVVPDDATMNAILSEKGPLSILAKTAIENGPLALPK